MTTSGARSALLFLQGFGFKYNTTVRHLNVNFTQSTCILPYWKEQYAFKLCLFCVRMELLLAAPTAGLVCAMKNVLSTETVQFFKIEKYGYKILQIVENQQRSLVE